MDAIPSVDLWGVPRAVMEPYESLLVAFMWSDEDGCIRRSPIRISAAPPTSSVWYGCVLSSESSLTCGSTHARHRKGENLASSQVYVADNNPEVVHAHGLVTGRRVEAARATVLWARGSCLTRLAYTVAATVQKKKRCVTISIYWL